DMHPTARNDLTAEMRWPGGGDQRIAAVVALLGSGGLNMADLVELVSVSGDVPVVAVDGHPEASERRALESGAEEVLRFESATIERLEHAVHSAVYRRGAEQNGRDAADALTGLATRATLAAMLPQMIDVAGQSGVALLYCDLDRFKVINDELGHLVGDQVLRSASGRLRTCVRASDLLVRLGGDEFVAVIRARPDRIEGLATQVAERIVDSFRAPFRAADAELDVGISVGLSVHREGQSSTELLKRADEALYVAKRRGKSRVVSYDEHLERAAVKRKSATDVLAEAMRADLLDAEVSPIIDMADSAVIGHLYRAGWGRVEGSGRKVPARRPETIAADGGVSPGLFRWLLGHIATDERSTGLPGVAPRRWVHIPGAALVSHPGRHLAAAARRGVDLENLVLVVAEADLDDGPVARAALLEIARTGARVAVGGFGAGAASLSVLEMHPFDSIVIDRQLTDGLASDQVRNAKLGAIASMARALGQRIVIDRPSRVEDERAALETTPLHVIDGRIDVTARRTLGRHASDSLVRDITAETRVLGGVPEQR
ncbi:MAG: diguanylate cyclase domain-containing protein, partial [Microthrixaceae bacterium]